MKKMNKVAAAVLAVAMVGSMAVPAFAVATVVDGTEVAVTGSNLTKSGKTKLTYTMPESYKWTIPDSITFTEGEDNDAADATVSVSNCYIKNKSTLDITIAPLTSAETETPTDDGSFKLDSAEKAEYVYEVKNAQSKVLKKGDNVLTVTGGTEVDGSTKLTFALKGEQTKKTAGTYEGYVKFTAAVTAHPEN